MKKKLIDLFENFEKNNQNQAGKVIGGRRPVGSTEDCNTCDSSTEVNTGNNTDCDDDCDTDSELPPIATL